MHINSVLIDNVIDLDVVMPMYNLLKYGKNYRKTTGSLWNEPSNPRLVGNPLTVNCNADPIANFSSFKYKTIITGKTSNTNQENKENTEQGKAKIKKNIETVVPLKYFSNFWITLNIPLINCEVFLTL